MFSSTVAAGAVALTMLSGIASASTDATVFAGFDPTLQNTFFTITNDSSSTETALTLTTSLANSLGSTSVNLAAQYGFSGGLAPGQSETYYFNGTSGGFLAGASANNLPDTTTYQLSLTLGGQTFTSNIFSTASNSTGSYVDFLGTNCFGYANACTDSNGNPITLAVSGTVGVIAAAVPEPSTWSLLAVGLVGAVVIRRRSICHSA
jgi:hypothetical protein